MKNAILPVLVIVLAVTSAFTTEAASKSRVATTVSGFLPHNAQGTDCEQKDDCSDVNNGILCRVGQVPAGQQLFILNANDQCLRTGYKP
jgi:hypothetical protein